MAGVNVAGWSKPQEILKSTTLPAANLTDTTLLGSAGGTNGIAPCLGQGTIRLFVFSNQAVTIDIFQKPAGSAFTMRQTDTQSVAASTGTPIEFLVVGDYFDIRITTTTAPTAFEIEVAMYP